MNNKCSGCGITKQDISKDKPGYVLSLENKLCYRCFQIKNYSKNIEQDIDSIQFIKKIEPMLSSRSIVYYVVDVFDIQGTRVKELEDILVDHHVVLVVNKIDLLPKVVKYQKIYNYVVDEFKGSKLNIIDIVLVSALKISTLAPLVDIFKANSRYKQIICGSSNVGKSSIVNSISKFENNKEIKEIVVSNYFNTTLEGIEVAINDNLVIYDTPGIQRINCIANLMSDEDRKYCFFKKELKQYIYQLNSKHSIVIAGLGWIEYLSNTDEKVNVTFYINNEISLHRTQTKNVNEYWTKNISILTPRINNDVFSEYVFNFTEKEIGKNYDILISGLGWINFTITCAMSFKIKIPTNNNKILICQRKPLI